MIRNSEHRNSDDEKATQSTNESLIVSEEDNSYVKSTFGSNEPHNDGTVTKLLGITWCSQSNEFMFSFADLMAFINALPATKRSLLKITAKIFDPLGFLSPFVIRVKILFQLLYSDRIDWDELLQGIVLEHWTSVLTELNTLDNVKIPKCYFNLGTSFIDIQLHGFSDASEQAFTAVLYLRCVSSDGNVFTRLVASKTRVSPVKKQSILWLELLGWNSLAGTPRCFNTCKTCKHCD